MFMTLQRIFIVFLNIHEFKCEIIVIKLQEKGKSNKRLKEELLKPVENAKNIGNTFSKTKNPFSLVIETLVDRAYSASHNPRHNKSLQT